VRNRLLAIGVLLLTVSLGACAAAAPTPTPLTAFQKAWCAQHDMTPVVLSGITSFNATLDDAVIEVAQQLHLTVPATVLTANSTFGSINLSGDTSLFDSTPPTWPDDYKAWKLTPDYARACVAAFDQR
jgi:hypothetical protein